MPTILSSICKHLNKFPHRNMNRLPNNPSEVSVTNFQSTSSMFTTNLDMSEILSSQSLPFTFTAQGQPKQAKQGTESTVQGSVSLDSLRQANKRRRESSEHLGAHFTANSVQTQTSNLGTQGGTATQNRPPNTRYPFQEYNLLSLTQELNDIDFFSEPGGHSSPPSTLQNSTLPPIIQHVLNVQFSVSNQKTTLDSPILQPLFVELYPPAEETWRAYRNVVEKQVALELKHRFNKETFEKGIYPPYAVLYKPPPNLIATQQAADQLVQFRREMCEVLVPFNNKLIKQESDRLLEEIEAIHAKFIAYYQNPNAANYSLEDALSAIATLAHRHTQKLAKDLRDTYSFEKSTPEGALWMGMPPHITVPENARRQVLPPGGAQSQRAPAPPRQQGPPTQFRGSGRGRGTYYRGQTSRQSSYPARGRGQFTRGQGQRGRGQGRMMTRGRGRGQASDMARLGRTLQQVIRDICPPY